MANSKKGKKSLHLVLDNASGTNTALSSDDGGDDCDGRGDAVSSDMTRELLLAFFLWERGFVLLVELDDIVEGHVDLGICHF